MCSSAAAGRFLCVPIPQVLQNTGSKCTLKKCVAGCCRVLQGVAGCCRVLQCVAGCCRVLQCVAVCCSVLQCVERTSNVKNM